MGLQRYCLVPALDVQFQHWMSSSSTGRNKYSFLSPVPALGAPCWHGASMGTSASQFQHRAKNRSQFQHWASANMGANIHINPCLTACSNNTSPSTTTYKQRQQWMGCCLRQNKFSVLCCHWRGLNNNNKLNMHYLHEYICWWLVLLKCNFPHPSL